MNKLLDQGYACDDIALMADQQPYPEIRITGINEVTGFSVKGITCTGFGSYIIFFKSGNIYVAKGGYSSMVAPALRIKRMNSGESWISMLHFPSKNDIQSFINKYDLMEEYGFKKGGTKRFYNKIWSPGRQYYRSICNLWRKQSQNNWR